MNTIKGPAIFLAQFMDDKPPFNSMKEICKWASKLGYKGIQIPTWDPRCIDLEKVANDSLSFLYVCHAAYVLHRARNVFNATYADWWEMAGECWNQMGR